MSFMNYLIVLIKNWQMFKNVCIIDMEVYKLKIQFGNTHLENVIEGYIKEVRKTFMLILCFKIFKDKGCLRENGISWK